MTSNGPPAHSVALLSSVQVAIAEAVYLASGYDITELKHCHVQISSNYRNSGDMKTNAAAALFLMHTARNNNMELESESLLRKHGEEPEEQHGPDTGIVSEQKKTSGRVMEVVTTSRYDLKAPRRYEDGKQCSDIISSASIATNMLY
jgi:hypothetical protein